jgi:hypothetical protein
MIYPTSGIIVKIGIFVKIARPRKDPDNKIKEIIVFLLSFLFGSVLAVIFIVVVVVFIFVISIANSIDNRKKGS